MKNVAFIGLGFMGYPMAGHISKAGKNVAVYNRTTSRSDDWLKDYTGIAYDTPAEASQNVISFEEFLKNHLDQHVEKWQGQLLL